MSDIATTDPTASQAFADFVALEAETQMRINRPARDSLSGIEACLRSTLRRRRGAEISESVALAQIEEQAEEILHLLRWASTDAPALAEA